MDIRTRFNIRDRVYVNGDRDGIVATVQRIAITESCGGTVATYEVSWFDSGGNFKEHFLYDWQLEKEEGEDK